MNPNDLGRLKAVERRLGELEHRMQSLVEMREDFNGLRKIVVDLRYEIEEMQEA